VSTPAQDCWFYLVQAVEHGDALAFAYNVLGFLPPGVPNPTGEPQLEPWQVEALTMFSKMFQARYTKPGRLAIRSGHGVGKTCFLSIILLFTLFASGRDVKIPVVANSLDQLRDGLWPEINKWINKLPDDIRPAIEWHAETVVLKANPTNCFAVRKTASTHRPEALQGIHADTVLAIFEEASGIPELTIETAQGSLSTPGAMAVAVGNPTRRSGFFYNIFTKPELRAEWINQLRVNSEDVPRARGHIQSIINLYGKDSNKYRVRVLGEFPTKDDDTVIPLEWVEAAKGRKIDVYKVWPVWGLDVARFGDDRTVLMKREGNRTIGAPIVWRNLDGGQVAGRVVAEYKRTMNDKKPKAICVDVINVGASVVDFLRRDPILEDDDVRIMAVNVAESAGIDDTNHRLRDELWWEGRKWFELKDCCIDIEHMTEDDLKLIEVLVGELTTPTYDISMAGKRVVMTKADMKKELGHSPDIADAFLNTFAAPVFPRASERHRRDEEHYSPNPWAA
jgi:phage terminase large subunit